MKEIYLDDERSAYQYSDRHMSPEEERRYAEDLYRKTHGYPSEGYHRKSTHHTMETPVSFIDMAEEYGGHGGSVRQFFDRIQYHFNHMDEEEKSEFKDMMKKLHEGLSGGHFNESYGRHEVSKMFHIEGNKKYVGEKFDMNKAREVKEMYKSIIPDTYTLADVYVAINSQYHDYAVLFKSWFGNSSDHKIIESAVNFWFRDDDCPECKVWDHFKD